MNWRQFIYVLFQTTRASYLAQEKNSSLGLIWHLLNPVLMTTVLFLVFRNIDRLRDIEHYQLFILIGLIHYNFFINSTTNSAAFFLNSRSLMLNTTVPLELLVLRPICVAGLSLVIEVGLVLVLGIFMGAHFTSALMFYPLILVGVLSLGVGAALFLCGLVVFVSDLNYVWGLICRVLFFLTPVFFTLDVAGEGFARRVLELNPLTGLITIARKSLLYGSDIGLAELALALTGPMLVLALGIMIFRSTRSKIPDYI